MPPLQQNGKHNPQLCVEIIDTDFNKSVLLLLFYLALVIVYFNLNIPRHLEDKRMRQRWGKEEG